MTKYIAISVVLFFASSVKISAQNMTEKERVKSAIETLFDGMRNSDSTMVRSVFTQDAIMNTVAVMENGEAVVRKGDLNAFLAAVGSEKEEIWDERIHDYDINIDGPLASVFTPYTFYRGDSLSHCGSNSFQLIRKNEGWKIVYIIDTRRENGCSE